jgi:flagellar assembly protein FliH
MTMASAMKFLFENSFDAEARAATPAAPVVIRQYTEQDLLSARSEGYADGEAAGRAAALAAIEQASQTALSEIAAHLGDLGGQIAALRGQAIGEAVKVVNAAIHKIVPELARRNAMNEIERLIRECLQAIYDEPRVVVRAHDGVIATLHGRIDGIAATCGFNGKIVLFGDEQLSEADCRVEWADGGAERNLGEMWKQIDAALARAIEGPAAEAPALDPARPETINA